MRPNHRRMITKMDERSDQEHLINAIMDEHPPQIHTITIKIIESMQTMHTITTTINIIMPQKQPIYATFITKMATIYSRWTMMSIYMPLPRLIESTVTPRHHRQIIITINILLLHKYQNTEIAAPIHPQIHHLHMPKTMTKNCQVQS